MCVLDDALLAGRVVNFVRPANVPGSIDVMELPLRYRSELMLCGTSCGGGIVMSHFFQRCETSERVGRNGCDGVGIQIVSI